MTTFYPPSPDSFHSLLNPADPSAEATLSASAGGLRSDRFLPSEGLSHPRASIGVFDSGVGGLTVLRELYRQLPQESMLYFGDTARVPYGSRSRPEILQFVREILTWFTAQQVKLVVMACNTSSALVLETVRSEFEVPILGVILPGARAAVRQGRRIGVIATPATAASNAYRNAIAEIDPHARVWQVGCPQFVPLIEAGRIEDPETEAIARHYLAPLLEHQIDTLVYGCTHYPHLSPVLSRILPASVRLVDPAAAAATAALRELDLLGLRTVQSTPTTRFAVSGDPEQFAQLSRRWLGFVPAVEQVEMPLVERSPLR